MKILLDTHFLVWLATLPDKITKREFLALERRTEPLIVSAISIWELRVKWHAYDPKRREKESIDPDTALSFAMANDFAMAPLEPSDCILRVDPPIPHKDPFDEMLLVHAYRLGARLMTRDRKLLGHPLTVQV
ncbi:type II toxin-antitoxin system VapC family toxin [Sphingomonas aliaeris]|uniref:Type II toxin-antitoxin system VapC family toxin n=1 Tax=Sphingomonas aliaeris TaxID=2759526 RepID=A0A974NTR4_9SPHN|nr:type II toxin-antitoxin system VapC family toxin [Sphingomonas aliaeris]QQV76613.1 type II toxin-antitoxin system VapC family toxin [Sphingomonas aliaeris]